MSSDSSLRVVMIGATGAVGTETVRVLVDLPQVETLVLLGRRELDAVQSAKIEQHLVDPLDPSTYAQHLGGVDTAICTLGVGEPSKVSKETFLKIDRDAVLDFGKAVKEAGARHFQLLSSVGASSKSPSFYLRAKGQLEDGLEELAFDRLSLFHPSMILTPTNRYGFSQAVTLAVWPKLRPLLLGPLRRYRGIKVATLGGAIARNAVKGGEGVEVLEWDDFVELTKDP